MNRLVLAYAIVLGWATAAGAAAPGTLTTLGAIHALTNAEASQSLPVAFEASVTYFSADVHTLFVQDDGFAIYVVPPANPVHFLPGDRILVRGKTQGSFRPIVIGESLAFVRHGEMPAAIPATFDDLIQVRRDCMLVKVRAVIRSSNLSTRGRLHLELLVEGGFVEAWVDREDALESNDLLDAQVEITGVASGRFDGKMQQTGVVLDVATPAGIRILKPAAASPWSLPVTSMDEVLSAYHAGNQTRRIRVQGTITYYEPGSAIVLQNGTKSLWIMTQRESPMRIGAVADVTGFPDVHDGFLTLTQGEIAESGAYAPIAPRPVSWRQLASSKNVFDLVSIEGVVVMEVRESAQDEYVLLADGQLFSAIFRHLEPAGHPDVPAMNLIPVGSRVRVAGICVLENSNPFDAQAPFNILLRSPADLILISTPTWINVRNLIRVVSALLLIVVAFAAWGWTLNRKVGRQTSALAAKVEKEAALERRLAQLELRRSRILEDINGSKPLAGILEEIAALVSYKLAGAACWCEVTDGARLGCYPAQLNGMRLLRQEIASRVGSTLGTIHAAIDPSTPPDPSEAESLALGAKMATLAIETRRLYDDLRHRSEFDLLTDIHNRFSLDRQIQILIDRARLQAGIFGLVYIDLDDFKLVNDRYGHRVGDLYLQEAALRMKRQLRSVDMLARVGGDEFAALVSVVRSRADVEEIAMRIERCFDEPVRIEGYSLSGSVSIGIAIYPDDGATRDSLLSTADAAMYVAKHTRRSTSDHPARPGFPARPVNQDS